MARKKAEAPQQQQILEQTPPETTQLVRVIEPYVTLPAPPTREEMVKQAEDQIFIFKQYMKLFSQEVRPEQVLLFGDNIYLPSRACQTLLGYARLRLKIQSPIIQHRFTSPEGEFIVFEAHGTVCHRDGTEIDDVVASQSTRDEFFGGWKEWECPICHEPTVAFNTCKTHGPVKAEPVVHFPPLYDVPIDDVLKKTTTNLFNRALQAIGMMPSLEDLQSGGMDISKVKRIGFKAEDKKPSPKPSTPPAQPPTQSSQQRQAAPSAPSQAPAAAPNPTPPRASIPPMANAGDSRLLVGTLDEVRPGTTIPKGKDGQPTGKPGNAFLGLIINGAKVTCFDNKELKLDTKQPPTTKHAFTLLAENVGMRVELRVKKAGQYENVTGYQRIGDWEWSEDGLPVLRREPVQDSFGSQFVATDEDIPF